MRWLADFSVQKANILSERTVPEECEEDDQVDKPCAFIITEKMLQQEILQH